MNNNKLTVITDKEVLGKRFQVFGTKENPLFKAKDVAYWLDYGKTSQGYYDVSAMLRTIDDEEKIKINTTINNPRGCNMWFLTEDGLYEVLMQSRKPIAKEFKKEVKKILKEIRLTGGYIPTNEEDSEMDILAKAVLIANKKIELMNKQIAEVKKIAEENREKAEAFTTMFDKNSFDVKSVANAFGIRGIGMIKLFEYLEELGWVTKSRPREPKQYALDRGYVEGVPCGYRVNRTPYAYTKVLLTEKGIRKLHKNLSEKLMGRTIKSIDEILSEVTGVA